MKYRFLFALSFLSVACSAQFGGFILNVEPDRKGEVIVFRVGRGTLDSLLFFSLKDGERVYAFGKDDNGRNLQLAKAGVLIQSEVYNKLNLSSMTVRDEKGSTNHYSVKYLDEYIGALSLDGSYERPAKVIADLKSKSVITWALHGSEYHYFNMTWKEGDKQKKKFVPFRKVSVADAYYSNQFLITPDGQYAYEGGRLYDLKKNREVWNRLSSPQKKSLPGALSVDGELLAFANNEDRVEVVTLKKGKTVSQLAPLPAVPKELTLWYIQPASDLKTYVAIYHNPNVKATETFAYMVFENGTYKELNLGPKVFAQ